LGRRRPEAEPWGGNSTGSTVQDEIDQLYWPPTEEAAPTQPEDDTCNFPVCYVFTNDVQMNVVVGQRAVSQISGAPVATGYPNPCDLEINIEQVTSEFYDDPAPRSIAFSPVAGADMDAIVPAEMISLRASEELDHTVGKETITVVYSFSYTRCGRRTYIPGEFRTSHVIYRVAHTPQPPQDTPWVCVLDYAVDWARGATSRDEVHSAMESALNRASGWHGEGQMPLGYDIIHGAANYAAINAAGTDLNVNLANFMMFLHRTRVADPLVLLSPYHETENRVNCLDCAALLPCFANAAGANLTSCLIGPAAGVFRLNCVKPIGWQTWEAIGLTPYGAFSFHAVTIEGSAAPTDTSHVYDSCLMLGTPDPTQFVNGAIAPAGNTRYSKGSIFDAPNSLTLSAATGPGGAKGTLNGRPSNTAMQPDAGPDSEIAGINSSYVVTLTAPLQYSVNRLWTAPAGTNNEALQAAGVPVRVPPAVPGAPTDCLTADGCTRFEIVDGAVPFVVNDTFTFSSTFNYDGEYRGALAAPDYPGQPVGRTGCVWLAGVGPFVPTLH